MATSAVPERRWPPPEDLIAHDPRNVRPPGYEVCCLACGAVEDLVLRGEAFLCHDQLTCQEHIRQKEETTNGQATRSHRSRATA